MDISRLIPLADHIPVPWGWFQVLLLFTFALHLVLMNLVVGGTAIAFVRSLAGTRDATPASKGNARMLPTILALAINLGVPPLLFAQTLYGQFLYSSSILMGWHWILATAVLMTAYYALYWHYLRFDALAGGRTMVLAVALALLLWVGFVLVNNMTLMLRPDRWTAWFDAPEGWLVNAIFAGGDPTVIPRWLHFMTASVAVAGLGMALKEYFISRRAGREPGAEFVSGMKWFTYATLVNVGFGIWFLMALPRGVMLQMMGGNTVMTALLILVIVGALGVLHAGYHRLPGMAVANLAGMIGIMVLLRDMVRGAYLSPWFTLEKLPMREDYSSLVVFLVSAVLGGAVMVWLVRMACKGSCPPDTAKNNGEGA